MSFEFNHAIRFANQEIAQSGKTYFIAEIGGNFNDLPSAMRLVDDAIGAGADAVKFQTFEASTITTKNNFIGFNGEAKTSQYENFLKSQPPKKLQKEVVAYAKSRGITIFSAPSHLKDLEFMEAELDLPIYKVGSDLATHIPLLLEITKTKKPLILSTGLCTLDEVRESVEAIAETGFKDLILLQCVSNYPAKYEETNIRAMLTLQKEFGCLVGFSDHTVDIEISIAAATLGAKVVERHFTYDKTLPGPDHKLSSTKEEFKKMVDHVRHIELALGNGIKSPSPSEMESRQSNRCSIIVMKPLKAGETITKEHIDVRRPGTGMKPKFFASLIGKKAACDIPAETPLKEEMVLS